MNQPGFGRKCIVPATTFKLTNQQWSELLANLQGKSYHDVKKNLQNDCRGWVNDMKAGEIKRMNTT